MAGLLQPTTRREAVLTLVPAKGPIMRTMGFSGTQQPTFGGTSSQR